MSNEHGLSKAVVQPVLASSRPAAEMLGQASIRKKCHLMIQGVLQRPEVGGLFIIAPVPVYIIIERETDIHHA